MPQDRPELPKPKAELKLRHRAEPEFNFELGPKSAKPASWTRSDKVFSFIYTQYVNVNQIHFLFCFYVQGQKHFFVVEKFCVVLDSLDFHYCKARNYH